MNRIEVIYKNRGEHFFGMNSTIRTKGHGSCIINQPLQAIKLVKGNYLTLNAITAFSYTLKRKVSIPINTKFHTG